MFWLNANPSIVNLFIETLEVAKQRNELRIERKELNIVSEKQSVVAGSFIPSLLCEQRQRN